MSKLRSYEVIVEMTERDTNNRRYYYPKIFKTEARNHDEARRKAKKTLDTDAHTVYSVIAIREVEQ